MKLAVAVKLVPSPEQRDALLETIRRFNAACNYVSDKAWQHRKFRKFDLHRLVYRDIRDRFGLTAQAAVRVVGKVADAYKRDHKTKREFQPLGAIVYDERILAFKRDKQAVSVWTVQGRLLIPYVAGERQRQLLRFPRGETDLVYRDGEFYMFTTVEVDEPEPIDVQQFLGVDVGIANIAADSEGNLHGAEALIRKRMHLLALRRKLQKAKTARRKRKRSTRSVRRRLKAIRRRERNYSRTVSHTVAKRIVATAKALGYGIAMEKLNNIRSRARFRREQRYLLHSWCFHQLQRMIEYKARMAGIPVVYVEPEYTSQTCSVCGYRDKQNRISQALFRCRRCGIELHADVNGARNIAGRALVSGPHARAA